MFQFPEPVPTISSNNLINALAGVFLNHFICVYASKAQSLSHRLGQSCLPTCPGTDEKDIGGRWVDWFVIQAAPVLMGSCDLWFLYLKLALDKLFHFPAPKQHIQTIGRKQNVPQA
jgi:hypothetical protein